MDLASVEDDQNAASSILLTAVTAGRLEDELKRIQSSATSSFTESMNAAVRLVVDCKSDVDLTNVDGASSSGNDRNDTSIFRKTVRIFYTYLFFIIEIKCLVMRFFNNVPFTRVRIWE